MMSGAPGERLRALSPDKSSGRRGISKCLATRLSSDFGMEPEDWLRAERAESGDADALDLVS